MKNTITYFFIVALFLSMPCGIMAETEWPSSTLKDEQLKSYKRESFDQLQAAVKSQPQPGLVSFVWILATQASPVDNRAYLMALAIDLYNTLPPDLMPEPPVLGPDEDPGEYAFTPFKRRFYSEMSGLGPQYAMTIEMKKERWASMEKKSIPEHLSARIEMKYLYDYVTEQLGLGNIVLDASDAPASLDPAKLDITNPTHYKLIREHMEKMQPAIDAGIPPWEAEDYLATDKVAPNTNTPTTNRPELAAENPSLNTEPSTTDITTLIKHQPHWLWYVLILGVVMGIAGVMFARRKK